MLRSTNEPILDTNPPRPVPFELEKNELNMTLLMDIKRQHGVDTRFSKHSTLVMGPKAYHGDSAISM